MDHYAEVFTTDPGQCFRMIQSAGTGHAMHCPGPIKVRGRFQSGDGRWHEVEACIEHAGDLLDWQVVDGALPPDPHGSGERRTRSSQRPRR